MGNMPVDVLGLGDKLFLRGTVVWEEREGYLYDTNLLEDFASHNLVTGSAKLRFLPIESLDLQVNYSGSYQPQKSKRGECEIDAAAEANSQRNREFNEDAPPSLYRSDFLQAVDSDEFTARIGDFRESCAASHELFTSTNMPNLDEIETHKIHGFITWDTPELGALGSLTVKSITAYQSLVQNFNFDWDSMALTMLHSNIPDLGHGQLSQELRVHGEAWGGRVFWTLGAFYLDEQSWGPRTTTVGLLPDVYNPAAAIPQYQPLEGTIREHSDFHHRTAAGYLFGEIQPIDPLRINAGFRYGWEEKTIEKERDIDVCMYGGGEPPCFPLVPVDGYYNLFDVYRIPSHTYAEKSNSWTAPTGNLAATWDITSDVHLYAGYQHGFSSGGFNYIGDEEDQTPNSFEPEELDGIEVGLKTTWWENRLTANLSYFFNFYRDMQVRIWEAGTSGTSDQFVTPITAIRNAGDATIQGGELELAFMPIDDLLLTGNFGLTFPQYEDFQLLDPAETIWATREKYKDDPDPKYVEPVEVYVDYTDNNFPNTPRFNFNVGARYTWQITEDYHLSPWINYSWRSKVYFDVANTEELSENKMGLLDASLTLEIFSTRTTIAAWVKNATDERYLSGGYNLGSYVSRFYAIPRTFGGTITQRFGGL
jgi:iron complex outermembrane receptor protein